MKFVHLYPAAALVAALLASSAQAEPHPLVDSTGVAKTVISTVQQALFSTEVTNIAGQVAANIVTNAGNTTGSVPPGCRKITMSMGQRFLGSGDNGLAAAGCYYGLNCPASVGAGGNAAQPGGPSGLGQACGGDTTQRVVVLQYSSGTSGDGGFVAAAPNDYYVCVNQLARAAPCRRSWVQQSVRSRVRRSTPTSWPGRWASTLVQRWPSAKHRVTPTLFRGRSTTRSGAAGAATAI